MLHSSQSWLIQTFNNIHNSNLNEPGPKSYCQIKIRWNIKSNIKLQFMYAFHNSNDDSKAAAKAGNWTSTTDTITHKLQIKPCYTVTITHKSNIKLNCNIWSLINCKSTDSNEQPYHSIHWKMLLVLRAPFQHHKDSNLLCLQLQWWMCTASDDVSDKCGMDMSVTGAAWRWCQYKMQQSMMSIVHAAKELCGWKLQQGRHQWQMQQRDMSVTVAAREWGQWRMK